MCVNAADLGHTPSNKQYCAQARPVCPLLREVCHPCFADVSAPRVLLEATSTKDPSQCYTAWRIMGKMEYSRSVSDYH